MPSPTDLHPATVRLLRTLAEPSAGISAETTVARSTWMDAGYPDLPRTTPRAIFGELVAAKRMAAGMTQRDLARSLAGVRGAHVTAVARWESGDEQPSAGQLAALFSVLPWSEVERAEALRRAYDVSLLLPVARQ